MRAAVDGRAAALTHAADEGADVKEYWRRAWHNAGRLRLWRLNPLTLSWNLARDTRHALLFFYAMLFERY